MTDRKLSALSQEPINVAADAATLFITGFDLGRTLGDQNVKVAVADILTVAGPVKGVPLLPAGTTAPIAADKVVMVQGGTADLVPYSTFLIAETIDLLASASGAGDTDTLMVGQGSNVLVRQSLGAIWSWIATHLPGYKLPIQELTGNTSLDATYNGKLLVVSTAGVTLNPRATLMGSGFQCEVITAGAGSVVWGSGFITSSGATTMAPGRRAEVRVFTFSQGTVVFADMGPDAVVLAYAPNAITSLAAASEASNALTFTWTASAADTTHNPASFYTVQYRVNGSTTWIAGGTPVAPTVTLSGLLANTGYDIEVSASNSAESSAFVSLLNTSTIAPSAYAPNVPAGLASGTLTSSSITWSWTASAVDGTHSAANSYVVETSTDNATWSAPNAVLSGTSYTWSSLAASTNYFLRVAAVNTVGTTAYSASVEGTTSAAVVGLAAPGVPTGLTAGTTTSSTAPFTWTAPSSGGAVASYTLQWRLTGGSSWTQITGIVPTSQTVSGLAASTGYDCEVCSVNATGASAFTAITTATTAASSSGTAPFNGAGYLLTIGSRTGVGPFTIGSTAVADINDNSISGDGSYTVPASVSFGWSTGNTVAPTTGLQTLAQITLDGHNQWTTYAALPASAGTYYEWYIAYNGSGTIVAAFVTPTAYTVTGGATYAPNIPAGLASGSASASSLTWTWTASVVDSTHGAAANYMVETSPDNSTWSAAVAVSSGTSYTWTGLTASTNYYLRVAGVNTVGTTAYSSSVEGTTSAASGAGYSLTYTGTGGGNIPTSGATYAHGAGGIIAQINDNSSSGDGSHTVPSSAAFAWSSSNTVAPTIGLQAAAQYTNGGHNMWVVYLNAPATAGTYYLWAIAYSSGSTVAATYVWPESIPIT